MFGFRQTCWLKATSLKWVWVSKLWLLHLRLYNMCRNGKNVIFNSQNLYLSETILFLSSCVRLHLWPKWTKLYWKESLTFNMIVLADWGIEKQKILFILRKSISQRSKLFSCSSPFVSIYHYLLVFMGQWWYLLLMRLPYFKSRDWNKPLFTNKHHLFSFGFLGS